MNQMSKGLQMTRLSAWTINNDSKPNWTQQNKNNSDELKTRLNKMEMTLTTTTIRMKSALNWTATKWCTHVDWSKPST